MNINLLLLSIISLITISPSGSFCKAAPQEKKVSLQCGLESCHGLDLKCGYNPPEICSQMYAIGDFCREYAKCEISDGNCVLTKNTKLNSCVACMKTCPTKDSIEMENCETKCRKKIEKMKTD